MTFKRTLPRIAVTPGEPAGIGPDIVLALTSLDLAAELVIIGDPGLLESRAARLKYAFDFSDYSLLNRSTNLGAVKLSLEPVPLRAPTIPGILDPANSEYVLMTLDRAISGCLSGEFDALVTGPVQKSIINEAGYPFRGHTEYLGQKAGDFQPVMMLVSDEFRVALVTTHLALREVPDAITVTGVAYVIRTVASALKHGFRISRPRIAVCGLNPHAGERGHLGREDIEVIAPAIQVAKQNGLDVTGPVPADTIFTREARTRFDVFITMFHDQGLPVLKALGFGHAVNVTLGLPFIRTSVDHGTALELAGTGRSEPGSLFAAVELAIRLIENTHLN